MGVYPFHHFYDKRIENSPTINIDDRKRGDVHVKIG